MKSIYLLLSNLNVFSSFSNIVKHQNIKINIKYHYSPTSKTLKIPNSKTLNININININSKILNINLLTRLYCVSCFEISWKPNCVALLLLSANFFFLRVSGPACSAPLLDRAGCGLMRVSGLKRSARLVIFTSGPQAGPHGPPCFTIPTYHYQRGPVADWVNDNFISFPISQKLSLNWRSIWPVLLCSANLWQAFLSTCTFLSQVGQLTQW